MIFFENSKIKEVSFGGSRIKEIYSGAERVWQLTTDTVEFAHAGAVNFSEAPAGFKEYLYANSIRADKSGFYLFRSTGPLGNLYLNDGHENFAIIPMTRGNDWVKIFVRDTDRISFIFSEKNIPVTITAKPAEGEDLRRSVVLDYASEYMIEDHGWGTANPSGTKRGVILNPGSYWLTSNKGLYVNGKWVASPGGWVDFNSSITTHIQLYYSGTRAYLVPGQTL